MSITNFLFQKLGPFLSNNNLTIPEYQREYSWEKPELEDFWQDLDSLIIDDKELHFLGQIVIHNSKEDSSKYIVDGQQRVCTSIILLSVLNDFFKTELKSNNNEQINEIIQTINIQYIGNTWDKKFKLVLSNSDKEFFREFIQLGNHNTINRKLRPSEKRIKDAYVFFHKKIEDKLENINSNTKRFEILLSLFQNFIEKFSILYFESDDLNEAYIIFETLNARGKELETSDLLKNHLFRNAKQFYQEVTDNWEQMRSNLGKIDATKFIRHLYNSQFEFIREKDLYKKLRERITSPKDALDFSKKLVEMSLTYSSIANPSEDSIVKNTNLRNALLNLDLMSATLFYPVLLALYMAEFREKDISEITQLIEILVLRNFVISNQVTNKFEISFAKLAADINNKNLISKEDVIKIIKSWVIDDEDFRNNFRKATVKKKPVIRYILREIYKMDFSNEIEIIKDNNSLHIEHVMPVNNTLWKVDQDFHDEFLWRLGNLTLLGSEYNKMGQNFSYAKKKEIYKVSQVPANRYFLDYERWSKNEIENRQKHLSDIAIKRWKLA